MTENKLPALRPDSAYLKAFARIMSRIEHALGPKRPAKRSAPVGVGHMAPDFTLEDQDRRKLTLSAEWKTGRVAWARAEKKFR